MQTPGAASASDALNDPGTSLTPRPPAEAIEAGEFPLMLMLWLVRVQGRIWEPCLLGEYRTDWSTWRMPRLPRGSLYVPSPPPRLPPPSPYHSLIPQPSSLAGSETDHAKKGRHGQQGRPAEWHEAS